MYESTLPFLQAELDYRTDRISRPLRRRKRRHLPACLGAAARGRRVRRRATADPRPESTKPW